jgi:hypothetical protein
MNDLHNFIQEICINPYADEIEFELKLLLDKQYKNGKLINIGYSNEETKKMFKLLFETIDKKYKLEEHQYVNFISKDGNNKQFEFKKGIKINESKLFYLKTQIKNYYINYNNISWKLKACREHKLSLVNDNHIQYNLIRFKRRFSTNILPEWRIDYTFTISIPYNSSEYLIRETKEKLFLIELFRIYDIAECVEVEIEYMFPIHKLTINSIENVLTIFPKITERPVIELYDYALEKIKDLFPDKIPKYNNRRLSIKQLLPQTLTLSKKEYFNMIYDKTIENYYISHKLDGERVLLFIQAEKSGYLTTTKWNELKINLEWSGILDCEFYNNIFYVFDILEYSTKQISYAMYMCPFSLRKQCLETLIKNDIHFDNISIKIKPFIKLNKNYSSILDSLNEEKTEYPNDGIIFTSGNDSYQYTKYFKWKPIKYMTIEFIAKQCPTNILGIPPYSKKRGKILYLLYVGIRNDLMQAFSIKRLQHYYSIFPTLNRKDYFPIHFAPSNNPLAYLYWNDNPNLDNKIVELVWNNEWELIKIRDDREIDYKNNQYYGNDYMIAELIWNSYSNPFTYNQLKYSFDELKKEFYFIKDNCEKYQGIRHFNNWVKNKILEPIGQNQHWLIDLGSGKGQDFIKYIKLGIRNIIFIDENPNNIDEIISRKYLYFKQKHFYKNSMSIYTICEDINNSILLEKINKFTPHCKLIICNFAIHYICYNTNSISNFALLINNILQSSGRLLITYLNGKKIFDKFKSNDWICGKYHFKRLFIANNYTGTNQKISVKLPFSEGFYNEYLFNIDLLIKELKKYKIIVETKGCFDEFLNMYQHHLNMNNKLNLEEDDVEYINLLEYIIFYKN